MKIKNIIINIIPLLIWVIYSKLTSMSEKTYFLMPVEVIIASLVIIAICIITRLVMHKLRNKKFGI